MHAKYVPEGRGAGSGSEQNLGQNIFHRPASSGLYAVVLNVDLYRIGYNDITMQHDLDHEERQKRVRAMLKAFFTLCQGCRCAPQHAASAHSDFSGVITTSLSSIPAPTVSSLNSNYLDEIAVITESLNAIAGSKDIETMSFKGLGEFSSQMEKLIAAVEPWGE